MITNKSGSSVLQLYRVLIIDDSESDFELYESFLAKDEVYQYSIHYAETAREGLQLFLEYDFDFILIDFSLPDMNGFKLIETIKRTEKSLQIPIVMMTGQGSEAIALQAMKQNIQDYLIKGDLNFSRFIDGIHRVITCIQNENKVISDRINNVLVVATSKVDLELYKNILENDENTTFNIHEVTTVKEALNFLINKKVDVILTDYELADQTGIDLAKAFKKLSMSEDTCIILITEKGNEQLVVDAIKAGISDYLIKTSITTENLQQVIKNTILKNRLLAQVNKSQFQRNLLSRISLKIRHSIDLGNIIQTSVLEIKQYLQCNRVVIYHLDQEGNGEILGEAVDNSFPQLLGLKVADTFFKDKTNRDDYIFNTRKCVINDITESALDPCHRSLLEKFQIKSVIAIPIIIENASTPLWGLLIAHFCKDIHFWEVDEINFLTEITFQISIGIQQGLLVEELRNERDRANAATRAKSAFLANMSHEIRTPMNAILGMTEILSISNLGDEEMEYINIIQNSGQSLLNLINDILDLSKLESGKVKFESIEFSLKDIIEDLERLFHAVIKEKPLTIYFDIADDLPMRYLGDPYRLKQILTNLIGNAVKFTVQGNIVVSVCKSHAQIDITNNKIELYFSVKDTGIGIPLESQNKLFSIFSQVDDSTTRKYGGTGLGLAICKQLIDLMGGKIGVRSITNHGSDFWFMVKMGFIDNNLKIDKLPDKIITNSELTPQKTSILVVEDNEINQKVIKSQLRKIGYDCDIVDNGQQVLELLSYKSYDVILMDCQMPVLDGYDTTHAIRQNEKTRDIIVIGVTAFAMKEDREKCINSGMNDYLKKPLSINALQEVLERWIP